MDRCLRHFYLPTLNLILRKIVYKLFNCPSFQSCKKCSTFLHVKFQVCKHSSKWKRIMAFKLQNIWITWFKIGFLFLIPAYSALLCWNLPQSPQMMANFPPGGTRTPAAFLQHCRSFGQKGTWLHATRNRLNAAKTTSQCFHMQMNISRYTKQKFTADNILTNSSCVFNP